MQNSRCEQIRPVCGPRSSTVDLDRATIAELAARMVRNGLVARVSDLQDKRRKALSLTALGQPLARPC
ncbi:winged helix DNA-binding protein [Pseudomonas fluorescens]|uniref:winged helix DNA-binding protein n=1 Tax=Pseudomonas fluorescens TaxID=294 RepID=UPI00177C9717|nr:winged helix DNA-binding protein [Pseudomonas fluorescens]